MAWWRAYIDKSNGDHSRVYDWEADTPNLERPLEGPELPPEAKLKRNETLNQVVSIWEPA